MTDLRLVKSDKREIDEAEIASPTHILAFEVYMLQQSVARIIELGRLYPDLIGLNLGALSECFAALADFVGSLSRKRRK